MKLKIAGITAAAVSVLLAACSGNSSSTTEETVTPRYVNGYVGASHIHNALLQAVPISASGQPATELDDERVEVYVGEKASTTSRAYYRVGIDQDNVGYPLTMIVLSKEDDATTARCQLVEDCSPQWAYGEESPVAEGFERRASVSNAMDNMRINVNWITHLASAFAYTSYIDQDGSEGDNPTTPRSGVYTQATIARANLWLNKLFGVADIISSQPLEPYDLRNDHNVSAAQMSDAVYYGALVAGAQKLAKDAGVDEETWLSMLVDDFLTYKGQLYQKGGTGISLYEIYAAAYQVLNSNRNYLASLDYPLPSQIDQVLTRLSERMADQQDGELTDIAVSFAEVENWVDVIGNTRLFVEDLNERLLNWDASHPDTCASGSDDDDDSCVHSFVDPAYVAKTLAYYNNLNQVYRDIAPGLNAITKRLRDASLDFIQCLNDEPSCAADSAYDAQNQTYAVNDDNTFRLTAEGIGLDSSDEGEDGYYAFDIFLPAGVLTVPYRDNAGLMQQVSVEFATLMTEDELGDPVENKPYVRVVYDQQYDTVPLTAVADEVTGMVPSGYVEPVGFTFSWPYFEIPVDLDNDDVAEQTGEFYFEATLLGVRDALAIAGGGQSPYHYNLSETGLQVLALGADEGQLNENEGVVTLGDRAEFTLRAQATNAGNYYSDSVWPQADDYFRVRDGFDAGVTESGLFKYQVQYEEPVLYGSDNTGTQVYRVADYLEVEVVGYGINRIEIFADDDVGVAGVRNCSVVEEAGSRQTESCTQVSQTEEQLSAAELIDGNYLQLFSVPARGAYKPLFNTDGDGHVILPAEGTVETLDGELAAVFTLGLDNVDLRMAHELVECTGGGDCLGDVVDDFRRLPLALVDINLSRETKDEWEVAVTAGYDYEYIVGGIQLAGERAQSLYISYATGTTEVVDPDSEDIQTYGYEYGTLLVFRAGVTLLGSESGEGVTMSVFSDVDYAIDPDADDYACGVINRQELTVNTCEAVAYLTFRNALIGVIREERDGVYVVRFIDGRFLILGG
tara:strand:- start:24264 stop:27323 length:3060 start_codon:yes stop_codon:yes gene_type:complete